jgi:hypothetical protein
MAIIEQAEDAVKVRVRIPNGSLETFIREFNQRFANATREIAARRPINRCTPHDDCFEVVIKLAPHEVGPFAQFAQRF